MTHRWPMIALAVGVLAITRVTPVAARQDRTVVGDVIKAARLINAMRFEQAQLVIAELAQKSPNMPEVRWLRSTLAFNTGDYAGAVAALDGVPDDAADGEVGQTRMNESVPTLGLRPAIRFALNCSVRPAI